MNIRTSLPHFILFIEERKEKKKNDKHFNDKCNQTHAEDIFAGTKYSFITDLRKITIPTGKM